MNRPSFARQALALALATTTLGAAAQTTPAAQLEKSQVLAGGNVVTAYRVPVVSSTGAVKYYDMSFVLGVSTAGVPSFSKFTTAVSPTTQGINFVAGTYKASDGKTCQVSTSMLTGGRQQVTISCNNKEASDPLSLSLSTGLLAGHPFQVDLTKANIGNITGYAQYAWGKVLYTYWGFNWGCLHNSEIVSAVQAGNQISIGGYDLGNVQICGSILTRQ